MRPLVSAQMRPGPDPQAILSYEQAIPPPLKSFPDKPNLIHWHKLHAVARSEPRRYKPLYGALDAAAFLRK